MNIDAAHYFQRWINLRDEYYLDAKYTLNEIVQEDCKVDDYLKTEISYSYDDKYFNTSSKKKEVPDKIKITFEGE